MISSKLPARRVDQKQQTRRRLVEVGSRLFIRRGAAVRMDDVARAAQVAHGTVFLHFRTRDQLLAAVIKAFAGRAALRIRELVHEGAGVRDVLQAHLEGLGEGEAFYARLVMEGALLPAVARTALLGIQSAVSLHLSEATQREVRAGRLRRLPPDLVFNTWLGLVNHYVVNRDLFAPGASVLKRHGARLIAYFLTLLKP